MSDKGHHCPVALFPGYVGWALIATCPLDANLTVQSAHALSFPSPALRTCFDLEEGEGTLLSLGDPSLLMICAT